MVSVRSTSFAQITSGTVLCVLCEIVYERCTLLNLYFVIMLWQLHSRQQGVPLTVRGQGPAIIVLHAAAFRRTSEFTINFRLNMHNL